MLSDANDAVRLRLTASYELAAHRVPPQLLGIVPKNATGFGGMMPAAKVFVKNELIPIQNRFRALNDWIGEEVINFYDYALEADDPTPVR